MEKDPNGLDQNTPGAKLDDGKVRAELVLAGFAEALWAVCEIGTYGCVKYTDNGWMEVDNGLSRYGDAKVRHQLKEWMGEQIDNDSLLLHAAHEAWNSLARLNMLLKGGAKHDFAASMAKLREGLQKRNTPDPSYRWKWKVLSASNTGKYVRAGTYGEYEAIVEIGTDHVFYGDMNTKFTVDEFNDAYPTLFDKIVTYLANNNVVLE